MKTTFKPKKLVEQVIVITGASSGIGLATAKLAASSGARVVLSSRNGEELERLASELRDRGGQAIAFEADVSSTEAMQALADEAVRRFGDIDTWVNNAGLSVYGKLSEVPMDEKRRVFEVNFWGVVNGCRAAVKHFKGRGRAGTIINVGSVLSDRAIPLQGIYVASKHAIKGYTDSLRMELEKDKLPIAVSLVKPSAIDTPYTVHARNHMEEAPQNPPPVYAPEVVARAILECAAHPKRDVIVGGGGKALSLFEKLAPRVMDLYMERTMFEQQKSGRSRHEFPQEESLYSPPRREGQVRGNYKGHVFKRSAYTRAALHPGKSAAAAFLAGSASAGIGVLLWKSLQRSENEKR